MKAISKAALLALAAASIGVTSLAPAFAQSADRGDRPGFQQGGFQQGPRGETRNVRPGSPGPSGFAHQGGALQSLLAANSAEAIDVAAVRLTHQLELTGDQQALLEDLRLAAQEASEGLVAVREAILPVREADADQPDLIARYAGIVAITTARAEALQSVQPALEAFVESLDASQIETLSPQRDARAPQSPRRSGPPVLPAPATPAEAPAGDEAAPDA